MKVSELIEKLQQHDPDYDVYVMDLPAGGDAQFEPVSIDQWDDCTVIAIDLKNPA